MSSYLDRLKHGRCIYVDGRLVSDPTQEPAFAGAIAAVCRYYSLQEEDPETYLCRDECGHRFPASLMVPKTREDLAVKRAAYKGVADVSFGMLGRTPDFVNAALAGIVAHSNVLGANEHADFSENVRQYYKHCQEKNLFVGHGSINPQIDRSRALGAQTNHFAGVHVSSVNARGITVSGAKMIATLAPVVDDLLIFNMPGLRPGDEDYALAFAIPASAEGLRMICRKPLVRTGYSLFDHPVANAFDEIDAYLLLKDVFVPWERVFVFRNVEKSNAFFDKTFARHHSGHQGIVRGLAKAELLTGVAIYLAKALGLDGFLNIQEQLGELTTYLEMLKGMILLSEQDATLNHCGVMTPSISAIQAVRYNFPKMYERMIKVIQSLAAGSMLSTPHHCDFENENGAFLRDALEGPSIDAATRVKLLNLAWDVSGDGFGQRQLVYEIYHAGDPVRIAASHYLTYDHPTLLDTVDRVLAL
jgi:4-hydroxyphenylacetate 3-monooxygenase